MKKINQLSIYVLTAGLLFTGCNKLDRLPETQFSDAQYWNTEND